MTSAPSPASPGAPSRGRTPSPGHATARTFAGRLTSRRGAWFSLLIVALAFAALFGVFGQAEAPARSDAAPSISESAQVQKIVDRMPGHDTQALIVVADRTDGGTLTAADRKAVAGLAPVIAARTGHAVSHPVASDDGKAMVLQAPFTVGATADEDATHITALRSALADHHIRGVEVKVTGGPAFGADITHAFAGANITLLMVTVGIVAVLLILTYRSPVLWLIPLTVIAVADQLAAKVTAAMGAAWNLQFDAGVVSVLVFGAGTNYALLLISRYREELLRTDDHRGALANAWRATAPAILASNVTVVVALASLALAVIPGTHGLGIAAAAGLLFAMAAVLFVLPPLLAVCGRRVFWPLVPRPDASVRPGTSVRPGMSVRSGRSARPGASARQGRVWRAIADKVVGHPAVALIAGLIVIGVMGVGLIGTSVGLTQVQKFRVPSDSAAGLVMLGEHFPAGEAQPMIVTARSDHADAVAADAAAVPGVVRVTPTGKTVRVDGATMTELVVVGAPAPGTTASLDLVGAVRTAVHQTAGADAQVGGAVATDVDARAGTWRDLAVLAPLVLAISFVVLLVLLRSLVAPVILLAINLASATAAIGAGSWLSRVVFGWPALDLAVPLLAFLFLVALGIDYTIFLVHRARTESARWGTKEGIARAVEHTGGVITSAGIVLAAVFAALGVLPLVTLGQLGLIVGIGVIADTLIVRTVIVPAVFSLLGDRIWWPGRPRTGYGRGDGDAADAGGDARTAGASDRIPVGG